MFFFLGGKKGTEKKMIQSRGRRLFIKNTGLCKVVRQCIESETCPVLRGERKGESFEGKPLVNGSCIPDGSKVAKFLVG